MVLRARIDILAGGYLTAKVVETDSNVFSLGLITAPVSDWRFYDTMVRGLPQTRLNQLTLSLSTPSAT